MPRSHRPVRTYKDGDRPYISRGTALQQAQPRKSSKTSAYSWSFVICYWSRGHAYSHCLWFEDWSRLSQQFYGENSRRN